MNCPRTNSFKNSRKLNVSIVRSAHNVKQAIDLVPVKRTLWESQNRGQRNRARNSRAWTQSWTRPEPQKKTCNGVYNFMRALPAIVAYSQRRRHGLDIIEPRDDLDYAANFLWIAVPGEEPDGVVVGISNQSMILYASTDLMHLGLLRALLVAPSQIYSAVVGAMVLLKGHDMARNQQMPIFDTNWFTDRMLNNGSIKHSRKTQNYGLRAPCRTQERDSRVPHNESGAEISRNTHRVPTSSNCTKSSKVSFTKCKGLFPNLDYPSGPRIA